MSYLEAYRGFLTGRVACRSLDLPLRVSGSEVFAVSILAQAAFAINVAELEVLAGPLDIIVDHIDEDGATEDALFLQDLVDQV